jgi:hypothetical protein
MSALHLHLIVSLAFNMTTEQELKPIPQPPTKFLVGNLGDLDPENAIRSMTGLIQQYGEIVKLSLIGREVVIVGSQALVNEVCDQTRFQKVVKGALGEVRSVAGDGMFFRLFSKCILADCTRSIHRTWRRNKLGACPPDLDACLWPTQHQEHASWND